MLYYNIYKIVSEDQVVLFNYLLLWYKFGSHLNVNQSVANVSTKTGLNNLLRVAFNSKLGS